MAFTSDQKHQLLRLPIVDAAVDEKDAFGFLGVPQVLTSPSSPSLDTSIKMAILRLPTVDATVDELDAYGFLGTPVPVAVGGPLLEEFSVDWNIDPISTEIFISFTGDVESAIGPFSVFVSGITSPTLIEPNLNPNAVTDVPKNYEICEFSGIKMYPGEGVIDWQGYLVHPAFKDPMPQREAMRYPSVEQTGAEFPEPEDQFITTAVSVEDL